METVPTITADDLSEEKVRAYRLADNKAGEDSEWNSRLLAIELKEISEINMDAFVRYIWRRVSIVEKAAAEKAAAEKAAAHVWTLSTAKRI